MEIPAVSVVVSLFNYEKYIGECLDSLLAQTFQNFEVIVVDDCSTDNSVAVVEGYAPQFGGRLTLAKLKKNSGGGGEPRNKGLAFSRGEYVFFMDADDVLIPNGLQEMYTLAKNFNADVVYCEKYFMSTGVGAEFAKNIQIATTRTQLPPFVDRPTLETNNLAERIYKMFALNYWMTPWLRLVQRNLLIDNDIKFDSLIASNDVGWTFKVMFCSKRFLRVPNPYYVRRIHEKSVSFRRRTPAEIIHKWMDRTIRSLKNMDSFMRGLDFFQNNPDYRCVVLFSSIRQDFDCILKECGELQPFEVYEIFLQKFGKYLGEHDVLVAILCAYINAQNKALKESEERLKEFNSFFEQANQQIVALDKVNREQKAYIAELENFVLASQQRIAELENALKGRE